MGVRMAPVVGSGSVPACMARVAKDVLVMGNLQSKECLRKNKSHCPGTVAPYMEGFKTRLARQERGCPTARVGHEHPHLHLASIEHALNLSWFSSTRKLFFFRAGVGMRWSLEACHVWARAIERGEFSFDGRAGSTSKERVSRGMMTRVIW